MDYLNTTPKFDVLILDADTLLKPLTYCNYTKANFKIQHGLLLSHPAAHIQPWTLVHTGKNVLFVDALLIYINSLILHPALMRRKVRKCTFSQL